MRLRRDAAGAVMVETLLAFLPLLMLFLGIVQQVLLAAAQLVVHHAAFAGARSASVVLDDDPARYEEVARLVIHDSRVAPVRDAVYAKLAAIVPSQALAALAGSPGVSVLDALGRSPAVRLAQAPLYLPIVTAITFPRAPSSDALFEERIEPVDMITVRVTHVATCTIPLVAALMCGALEDALVGEIERAPAAASQRVLADAGARGVILQAEASMPLQDAPYPYASQEQR